MNTVTCCGLTVALREKLQHTSAFCVQLYVHMIQRGQLLPLRVWDGYGGHCRNDLLFFVRLLCCVCVNARDLPVGYVEEKKKGSGGKLMETCHQVCFTNAFTKHNVSHTIFNC